MMEDDWDLVDLLLLSSDDVLYPVLVVLFEVNDNGCGNGGLFDGTP